MNLETGELQQLSANKEGWVQLDLYDPARRIAFDSKVGFRGFNDKLDLEAASQAALVEKGFLNGVFWISLPNDVGAVGFSKTLLTDSLFSRDIRAGYWTGSGMTWYKPIDELLDGWFQ